jgi:hypothetical protein
MVLSGHLGVDWGVGVESREENLQITLLECRISVLGYPVPWAESDHLGGC